MEADLLDERRAAVPAFPLELLVSPWRDWVGAAALMSWSLTEPADRPRTIGVDPVERAVSLWSDYYRPHANAFFGNAAPTDVDCQARRVVRWLQADGRTVVSRTEVTRLALGRTVDARGADRVVARLVEAGALRAIAPEGSQRGRPALRWQVNPMLATA